MFMGFRVYSAKGLGCSIIGPGDLTFKYCPLEFYKV